MRLTVLGGTGAWPGPGQACSGYLVEHEGFRLLVDPGYATLPRLLERAPAGEVDAVFVTHGHPDHCVDLNPLLRARAMGGQPLPPLAVYSLPGALDAVLALDRPQMLAGTYEWHRFDAGDQYEIGPFAVQTRALPHSLPNVGVRLRAGDRVLAYTGDSAPSPEVVALARDADLLLAEATYVDEVPENLRDVLSSARDAGREAAQAGVGRLLLTHLWPGTDSAGAVATAAAEYGGELGVATMGDTLL
jgi:ribonuclease BN (tRNA processing enzyme)